MNASFRWLGGVLVTALLFLVACDSGDGGSAGGADGGASSDASAREDGSAEPVDSASGETADTGGAASDDAGGEAAPDGDTATEGDTGADAAPGDDVGPFDVVDFCDRLTRGICKGKVVCCEEPRQYDTEEECRSIETVYCQMRYSGDAYTDGRILYHTAVADTLIGEVMQAASGCLPLVVDEARLLAVFEGTIGEGQSCASMPMDRSPSYACEPDLMCTGRSGMAICEPRGGLGDDCGAGAGVCEVGLYCSAEGCAEKIADGMPCELSQSCETGFCDGTCRELTSDDIYCGG